MTEVISNQLLHLISEIKTLEDKLFYLRQIEVLIPVGFFQNRNNKGNNARVRFDYCDEEIILSFKISKKSFFSSLVIKKNVDLIQEKVFFEFGEINITNFEFRRLLSYLLNNYNPTYLNIKCK